jgi:hypothetical protein
VGLSNLTSREAVLAAIEEFDRLGRAGFLDKYGFGKAREYFLSYAKKLYDSKAVCGAAYGFQYPRHGPLKASQFSGGYATVREKLEDLGFDVRVIRHKPATKRTK